MIMALLLMAMLLSSILWLAVQSWYGVRTQNVRALRELRTTAATMPVRRTVKDGP